MAETQLYMAPMSRKKRVYGSYNPNTYRVMSTDAEKLPQVRPQVKPSSFDMPTVNLIGQPITTEQALESRHNRPNPMHVSFLQGNVKCMNDPVCHVQTAPLQKYEHDWWPSRTSNEPLHSPQYSLDSFYRREYHPKKHVHGFSRHESNPNKLPAQGIAPITALRTPNMKQRLWKEQISFEHQYNSRSDPSYPVRGKRHGSLVWSKFSPSQSDKMLHSLGYIDDKDVQTSCNENSSSTEQTNQPNLMALSSNF